MKPKRRRQLIDKTPLKLELLSTMVSSLFEKFKVPLAWETSTYRTYRYHCHYHKSQAYIDDMISFAYLAGSL